MIKKIISLLIVISFLVGCQKSDYIDNKTPENVAYNFITALKNYDYEEFKLVSTDELLNSEMIVISKNDTENATFYDNQITPTKFISLKKHMETQMIKSYNITKKEKTNLSAGYMEYEENNKYLSDVEDKDKQYYKVYGNVLLPNIETIKSISKEIFIKNLNNFFNKKVNSKDEAINKLMNYYIASYDEIYKKAEYKSINIEFYVYQDKNDECKVNDADIYYYMKNIYTEINNGLDVEVVNMNPIFIDTYMRIALSEEEYIEYKKSGKLPDEFASWKDNQTGLEIIEE